MKRFITRIRLMKISRRENSTIVGDGYILGGLNVLIGKENDNSNHGGYIRLARVVHSGDAQSEYFLTKLVLTHQEAV